MSNGRSEVVVVTGATKGVGRAIAERFAREGATVAINYGGDRDGAEATRRACDAASREAGHGERQHLVLEADVSSHAAIDAMFAAALAAWNRLDVLVNNAGIQHVSPVEEFPPEKWNAIIAINLSAVFHATRAALPGMKARGWGRIINTASAHSLVASPFKSAYVAAKHGVAGFTKTVALEVATQGITVNCISPGYVWTPLVERQIPDTMKARGLTREQVINDVLLAAQPSKQFVTVDQVAALAVFLCSDAASQITGANLSMDGGWTAA